MKRRLLLILIICAFYTLGTEITRTGSCPKPPTLKPVANFSLSELEGRYAALAFYSQVPSLGLVESCYRMTFTQINDNRTYVEARWKPALLYIGIPLQTRYYLEQTSDNGTFDMLDGILQLYRGEAYILSNNENITVMYTCRYTEGLIPLYSQDVLVLSQNTVYAPDDQEAVKAVLKDNELDYGFLRNVEQGREECTQILKLD